MRALACGIRPAANSCVWFSSCACGSGRRITPLRTPLGCRAPCNAPCNFEPRKPSKESAAGRQPLASIYTAEASWAAARAAAARSTTSSSCAPCRRRRRPASAGIGRTPSDRCDTPLANVGLPGGSPSFWSFGVLRCATGTDVLLSSNLDEPQNRTRRLALVRPKSVRAVLRRRAATSEPIGRDPGAEARASRQPKIDVLQCAPRATAATPRDRAPPRPGRPMDLSVSRRN